MVACTFIVASVYPRLDQLARLIHSIRQDSRWDDCPIHVCLQKVEDKSLFFSDRKKYKIDRLVKRWDLIERGLGPHNARLRLLEEVEGVVCALDDDMYLLPSTNYIPIIKKVQEKGIGLVSGNWVKTEKWLGRIKPVDAWVQQHIVYTGGGLFFGPKVAEVIRAIPPANYWCDNTEWSLASYLKGYLNFRYRGSMAVHNVCQRGGLKGWKGEVRKLSYPDQSMISYTEQHIPNSKGLTDAAKKIHTEARAQLMGV